MSLDKAIAHGKERRRPYYRSGRVDLTCRPGGGCPWCDANRRAATRRREDRMADSITEADDTDAACFPFGSTH